MAAVYSETLDTLYKLIAIALMNIFMKWDNLYTDMNDQVLFLGMRICVWTCTTETSVRFAIIQQSRPPLNVHFLIIQQGPNNSNKPGSY